MVLFFTRVNDTLICLGLAITDSAKLNLKRETVQLQHGVNTCGLFATISFIVELLVGGEPSKATFDQMKMRERCFGCVTAGSWTAFPKTKARNTQRVPGKVLSLTVSYYNTTIDVKVLGTSWSQLLGALSTLHVFSLVEYIVISISISYHIAIIISIPVHFPI